LRDQAAHAWHAAG
jgi:hypothetical protein